MDLKSDTWKNPKSEATYVFAVPANVMFYKWMLIFDVLNWNLF